MESPNNNQEKERLRRAVAAAVKRLEEEEASRPLQYKEPKKDMVRKSSKKELAEEVAMWKFFIQEAEKEGKVGRGLLDKVTLPPARAAELLEIEVGTLQWMADQGKIPCVKTESGRVHYRVRDLVAFLEERC